MIKEEKLTCPSCRNTHTASSVDAFPISYDMEAIIRKLKILQYKAEFSSSPDGPAAVKEKGEGVKRVLGRLQETLTQLGRYEGQLQDWVGDHNDLVTSLQELVEKNQSAVRLLQDEQGILQYQRTKGEEAMRQLEAMKETLAAASSPQEAVSAIDESEAKSSEAEDWMEHCHTIFPDHNTAHTSLTVSHALQNTLTPPTCNFLHFNEFCDLTSYASCFLNSPSSRNSLLFSLLLLPLSSSLPYYSLYHSCPSQSSYLFYPSVPHPHTPLHSLSSLPTPALHLVNTPATHN